MSTAFKLPEGIELVQTAEGTPKEYSGPRSFGEKKTIIIDRKYEVRRGDEVLGYIEYKMATREQRTPGKMYVNRRWQSPAWFDRANDGSANYWRSYESTSKTQAIRNILRAHGIDS
jgi:hypothetical protein